MRGRIGHAFFLVLRFDHEIAGDENGADGHIATGSGISGACQRDAQIPFILLPARLERATPAFGGQYSIQLSYGSAWIYGPFSSPGTGADVVGICLKRSILCSTSPR